jgi:hypothetical protein
VRCRDVPVDACEAARSSLAALRDRYCSFFAPVGDVGRLDTRTLRTKLTRITQQSSVTYVRYMEGIGVGQVHARRVPPAEEGD